MKIGSVVITEYLSWPKSEQYPEPNTPYEVEGFINASECEYIYLVGFTEVFYGQRNSFRKDLFREVEFPPSLMEEIEECLERKLVEKI